MRGVLSRFCHGHLRHGPNPSRKPQTNLSPARPRARRPRTACASDCCSISAGAFIFGHANDATKDFGFGAGRSGGFQKTGGFLSPSNLAYDDSDWKPVDLPHDRAIELPSQESIPPPTCLTSVLRNPTINAIVDRVDAFTRLKRR
jgi:hypothetical protein